MRRSVLAFTWVVGTTMSVVLAWWGVSVVGEQVATRRDTPFEEAIDVPPATTPATVPVTEAPPPVEPDPSAAAAITRFLDAATSTTVPAVTTAPPASPTTSRPRPTTVPTGAPAADPPPADASTTTATTAPATSTPTAAPPTAPPATTGTTLPTTTTSAPTTTSTAPFPPGWNGDDRGAFEPKDKGTSTYTFDCGSVTIRWQNYRVLELTADLRDDHRSCIEHYNGADLVIRQIPETGETEFVVTYPDGSVDRWVMPPPANWHPPTSTTTTTAPPEGGADEAEAEITA